MRDDDKLSTKARKIEIYDPISLTRCYTMSLESILKEAEEFLKTHKATGNLDNRSIDTKKERDQFSILTLTEEFSAVD